MLALDITRCMGVNPECPQRLSCARHRDLPRDTPLSWARNLNIGAQPTCPAFIPFGESDD